MDAMSAAPVEAFAAIAVREIEQPFLGRWTRLVSTTNWEKGRIIHEWRDALSNAGEAPSEFSDDAWSRRVGGVTSQHVGRLRRVYDRFGSAREQYAGLFWSHFQAALDWDDAEMWLEGGVQNGWSVAAMRRTRWETLGAVEADRPSAGEDAAVEIDEDYLTPEEGNAGRVGAARDTTEHASFDDRVTGRPIPEGADFGDDDTPSHGQNGGAGMDADTSGRPEIAPVHPFANLAELPADFADAFDAMKLALLRHKADSWQQISRADALAALDALKELACAPSPESAPF